MRLLELCNERWNLQEIQGHLETVRTTLSTVLTQPLERTSSIAPAIESGLAGISSDSQLPHSWNQIVFDENSDVAIYAAHPMEASNMSTSIPATPPPPMSKMPYNDISIDTTFNYLSGELTNWDPNRLVTLVK